MTLISKDTAEVIISFLEPSDTIPLRLVDTNFAKAVESHLDTTLKVLRKMQTNFDTLKFPFTWFNWKNEIHKARLHRNQVLIAQHQQITLFDLDTFTSKHYKIPKDGERNFLPDDEQQEFLPLIDESHLLIEEAKLLHNNQFVYLQRNGQLTRQLTSSGFYVLNKDYVLYCSTSRVTCFLTQGQLTYVGYENGDISLYDKHELLKKFEGHIDAVRFLKLDGYTLISAGEDHRVCVWNMDQNSPSPLVTFQLQSRICAIAYSGLVRKALAAACYDFVIYKWSLKEKQKPISMIGHKDEITGLQFVRIQMSNVDWVLVSCSLDGTLRVWNPENGKELLQMKDPSGKIIWMKILAHKVFAFAGDSCLRVWDIASGKCIKVFQHYLCTAFDVTPWGILGTNGKYVVVWSFQ